MNDRAVIRPKPIARSRDFRVIRRNQARKPLGKLGSGSADALFLVCLERDLEGALEDWVRRGINRVGDKAAKGIANRNKPNMLSVIG
ncbi:hypothetical protein CCR96_13370 [Halochromatium roseum]|nr:hypothetical protein [Halochromatium roseum]